MSGRPDDALAPARRRILLCDSVLVTGYRHRLDAVCWRLVAPDGQVYRLCSLACLVTLACEPGALWGFDTPRAMSVIGRP
jgi:hypothetical protein